MELIDFHTHWVKRELINPTYTEFLEANNPAFMQRIDDFGSDPLASVNYFKSQGVKYAVVLAECAPATSAFVSTEAVVEHCQGEGMLIPFASLNPNTDPEPATKLEHYVKDCGVKGLKLLPSYQFFYPNEARLYPLYASAQKLNIPVMFHIGSSTFKGTRIKYCDPIYLDDIAVDFPNLKIVMAHSGRGFWYAECFFLSRLHKNVYMDITGLPPRNLLRYFPELDSNGGKVIFGSDWPAMPKGIKENVDVIKALPLSSNTIEGILYRNAEKILFDD